MKKHEDKKMASSCSNIARSDGLRLRVRKCLWSKLDVIREVFKTFIELAKAGLFSAIIGLIALHPWMLFGYLIAVNQIGNIRLNYLLLTVWFLDLALAMAGSIIMEGKRKGVF